jgi:hypothetical protein
VAFGELASRLVACQKQVLGVSHFLKNHQFSHENHQFFENFQNPDLKFHSILIFKKILDLGRFCDSKYSPKETISKILKSWNWWLLAKSKNHTKLIKTPRFYVWVASKH